MSGVTIGYDVTSPAATDLIGQGDDVIRSLKTNLQGGLAAEHLWPAAGGLSGVHLAGSARVFVGANSAVSSADTTGRMMWDSTNSRLHYVGSEGTVLIGGKNSVQALPSYPTLSAHSMLVMSLVSITASSWPQQVTHGLSTAAYHFASVATTGASAVTAAFVEVYDAAASTCRIQAYDYKGAASTATITVNVLSYGYGTA